MHRLFPLFAMTVMLATAAPLIAEGYTPGSPQIARPAYSIWTPVQNVSYGGSTVEFQYAAPVQMHAYFLRVLLPPDTRELLLPDQWTVGAIHDLTGWRTSLSLFGEGSGQGPLDGRYYENQRYYEDRFPLNNNAVGSPQVFNIAIGAQY